MIDSVGGDGFALPTGTVAFLLTEVENSTLRWEAEPDAMAAAMDRHNAILDAAVSGHGGVSPPAQGEGDSIVAAFARASDATLAARDAQLALVAEPWPTASPLRVRMAVHAGEARFIDDGNYAGHAIIRTARLRAIAHGGQVLVSAAARDLTVDQLGDELDLIDLGDHRLKDLARPERVWQLVGPGLAADFPALSSLDSRPNNLPVSLSSFVGRLDDIATVSRLLHGTRLVTITGTGGAGKTRLAQQVAAEVLDRHRDGVWWVELAELTDAASIPAAIAHAVGAKSVAGDGAVADLAERLSDQQVLVVLDNCEHLVGDVAAVADQLLRRAPGLVLLATSREPLAVDGEVAWRIPPLAIPPERHTGTTAALAALSQFDAVRLFLDRAVQVRPNFHLDDGNAADVAAICHRLDGIPLAIELAAARCRSLTPARIHAGLADSFKLLTGGGRTALPRQQTLEASIAWSHELLTQPEQILLRRLSVFTGGCGLDDAEAVVADDALAQEAVLDLLDRLVAQSLVHLDDEPFIPRYLLLETVRHYAARRLVEAGEADALTERHARRYHREVVRRGPRAEVDFDLESFAWLVAELDNFAAAVAWFGERGDVAERVDLADHLALIWGLADPPAGERVMSRLLDEVTTDEHRMRTLLARAQVRSWSGDMLESAIDAMAASELAERLEDDWRANRSKLWLSQALPWVDIEAGNALAEECIAESHRLGDSLAEVLASISYAGVTQGLRGDLIGGGELVEGIRPLVEAFANPIVSAWWHAHRAVGYAFRSRADMALPHADEADRLLADLSRAMGARTERLQRASVPGSIVSFARAYAALLQADSTPYLDELPRIAAECVRAGFLLAPCLLEISIGVRLADQGDLDGAEAAYERCRSIGTTAGIAMAVANVLPYWSDIALARGDGVEARRRLSELDQIAAAEHSNLVLMRVGLRRAVFALEDGEPGPAEQLAHQALALAHEQDTGWELFLALQVLAEVALVNGAPEGAARLAGAVRQVQDSYGFGLCITLPPHHQRYLTAVDAGRALLGDEAWDTAFEEGRALSSDEAVSWARRMRGERRRPAFGWDSLTPTERQVVEHVALGRSNPEIAEQLFVSRETVKTHVGHVFTKLNVRSRAELAALAASHAVEESSARPRG